MKFQYFLRGLGVGIVLTALILCISYRASDSKVDVVEEAKKLGMVFPEGTIEPAQITLPPSLSATPSAVDTPSAEPDATGERAGETSSAAAPSEPAATPTDKPTAKPPVKTKRPTASGAGVTGIKTGQSATKKNRFTVRSGLLSSSVAREMKEAGIIDDDKAFDEYLEDHGESENVRAGTYDIPEGASFAEITKIITRKK